MKIEEALAPLGPQRWPTFQRVHRFHGARRSPAPPSVVCPQLDGGLASEADGARMTAHCHSSPDTFSGPIFRASDCLPAYLQTKSETFPEPLQFPPDRCQLLRGPH